MFCSECGKPAQGKFCSHCGHALIAAVGDNGLAANELVPDWEHEIRYETILQYPGVRAAIERQARTAKKQLSGEDFLAIADAVLPLGVAFEKLAGPTQSLFTRWGIKTDKRRVQHVAAPAGRVLVRALCSLAHNGQTLRNVTQASDGCLLEAALPSDVRSLEGDLLVNVRQCGRQASVEAAVHIGGQLFDWGKSTRCLDQLFDDLARDAA